MRTKPYTDIGIRRKKCFRCGQPARTQWNICADGGQYRPLCLACDIELNRLVLEFMRFEDGKKKILQYEVKMQTMYGGIHSGMGRQIEVITPKRNADGVALLPQSELDGWEYDEEETTK